MFLTSSQVMQLLVQGPHEVTRVGPSPLRRPRYTYNPWGRGREGGKLGRGGLGRSAVLRKFSEAGEKSSRPRESSEDPTPQHGPRILATQSSAGLWEAWSQCKLSDRFQNTAAGPTSQPLLPRPEGVFGRLSSPTLVPHRSGFPPGSDSSSPSPLGPLFLRETEKEDGHRPDYPLSMQVISPLPPPSILNPHPQQPGRCRGLSLAVCPRPHPAGRGGPTCLVITPFLGRGRCPCPCTMTVGVPWGAQGITWVPPTFLPAPMVQTSPGSSC